MALKWNDRLSPCRRRRRRNEVRRWIQFHFKCFKFFNLNTSKRILWKSQRIPLKQKNNEYLRDTQLSIRNPPPTWINYTFSPSLSPFFILLLLPLFEDNISVRIMQRIAPRPDHHHRRRLLHHQVSRPNTPSTTIQVKSTWCSATIQSIGTSKCSHSSLQQSSCFSFPIIHTVLPTIFLIGRS